MDTTGTAAPFEDGLKLQLREGKVEEALRSVTCSFRPTLRPRLSTASRVKSSSAIAFGTTYCKAGPNDLGAPSTSRCPLGTQPLSPERGASLDSVGYRPDHRQSHVLTSFVRRGRCVLQGTVGHSWLMFL